MVNRDRSRQEARYIAKMTKLQTKWKNPIDGDWSFVRDWSDEELEKQIRNTITQLRFERSWSAIITVIGAAVGIIVMLGVLYFLVRFVKWAWEG